MTQKLIGALTIGQSPRPDILCDIAPVLSCKADILEAGALDGLTDEQVEQLAPVGEEAFLITRFNGRTVRIAERHMFSRLQKKVDELENRGVQMILILCTVRFNAFQSAIPILSPGSIISAVVPACSRNSSIGVLVPEEGQVDELRKAWEQVVSKVKLINASPYGSAEELRKAAESLGAENIDLIVPDCMGYTQAIKDLVAETSKKPVILPRTLAARIAVEML